MKSIHKASIDSYLKLHGWKIKKLSYIQEFSDYSSEIDGEIFMAVNTSDIKEDNTAICSINIKGKFDIRNIELEIVAVFEVKADLSIDEKKRIIEVNGTAIIYPYIRSVMSVVSGIDGSSQVTLPIMNIDTFINE